MLFRFSVLKRAVFRFSKNPPPPPLEVFYVGVKSIEILGFKNQHIPTRIMYCIYDARDRPKNYVDAYVSLHKSVNWENAK